MKDLVRLDPSRFDAREHAALCWVRETLTSIQGASEDTLGRFEEAFDERHREYVVATMKAMYFFNLLGNTAESLLLRLLGRDEEQTEVCELVYD
ncbi:MAG: hypothetical protein JW854_17360 [Actinobacteria bacterium]|nr:hypothetical protein [Actinomycetota bacterium]